MAGWKAPENDEVTRALGLIGDPQNARMFFSGLENPWWLSALQDRNIFAVAAAVENVAGEGVRFPDWPEGIYLARMAPLLPDKVTALLLAVDTNGNAFAEIRVLEAAAALPPEHAVRLVDKAVGFLGKDFMDLLATRMVEFIGTVARSGDREATKKLANAVFRPPSKLDQMWYEIELPNVALALQAFGSPSVSILTDWLHALEERDGSWNSHVFRPSISPHRQNWGNGYVNSLVDAARDIASNLIGENPELLNDVIGRLEEPVTSSVTSQRIALYVLSNAVDAEVPGALALAQVRLMNSSLINRQYRREYSSLARATLKRIDATATDEWFEFVSSAPDMSDEDVRRMTAFFQGVEVSNVGDEEVNLWRKHRLREQLMLVEEALPEHLRLVLADLDDELGPRPQHPDFAVWTESFVGPTAPVTDAELRELDGGQIVTLLSEWEPDQTEHFGPSREGLGRGISAMLQEDPDKLNEVIDRVLRLRATYVRAVLAGWVGAIREHRQINWSAACDVLDFVTQQADEGDSQYAGGDDPGWRWSHQEAVRLLQGGLSAADERLRPPPQFADRILEFLGRLCESPDPTPGRDEGSWSDPLTASLNAVRSSAIAALIVYLAWLEASERISFGGAPSDSVPRVWSILDNHLDPAIDSSPAVRAVYGQDLPFLHRVSPEWAEANIERILGLGGGTEIDARLRDVGWASFLFMRNPTRQMLELLKPIYQKRLSQRSSPSLDVKSTQTLASRIGEHILFLYAQGAIDLNSEDGLVKAFFTNSDSEARASALSRLGWHLERWDAPTNGVIERLQQLWNWRMEAIDQTPDLVELASFGSWFRSGKFPRAWAVQQLTSAARLGASFEIPGLLVEKLSAYAREFPGECIAVLSQLIEGKDLGEITWVGRQAAPILAAAMDSGDKILHARAIALMDRLGRLGVLDLADEVRGLTSGR